MPNALASGAVKFTISEISAPATKDLNSLPFLSGPPVKLTTLTSSIDVYKRQVEPGWTSVIISIWVLGGLQLFAIGIIGEYIGKTYMETKRRPRYLIESVLLDAVAQEDTPGRE